MSELAIRFSRRVRPLRIGYRVDPQSEADLIRAIETATAQWGGILHPLIPAFRRRPSWWQLDPFRRGGAAAIEQAYLEAFSCDFVVEGRRKRREPTPKHGDLTLQQLRRDTGDEGIEAGMPAAAVYRQLWSEEFRWDANNRPPVVIPMAEDPQLELFVAACFGFFAGRGDLRGLKGLYHQTFDAKPLSINGSNFLDGFSLIARDAYLTPLAMNAHGLSIASARMLYRAEVMLVDTGAPSDVLDFWNLRASGRRVLPVPLRWCAEVLPELGRRLAELPAPRQRWDASVLVLGGHRVPEQVVKEAMEQLVAAGVDALRSHYPSPGRELGAAWSSAHEDEVEATSHGGRFQLPLPQPAVAQHYPWSSTRWIDVVNYLHWTLPSDGSIGALLPPELGDVSGLLNHHSHHAVRASREGLLISAGVPRDHFDFVAPTGDQILSLLLTGALAGTKPSEPGRVATQLIKQMRGLPAVGLVQRRELVELFNRAAEGAVAPEGDDARRRPSVRFLPRARVEEAINRVHPTNLRARRNLMRGLIERDVLRAGLQLDCTRCHYSNWIELGTISQTVRCERCLDQFPFPQDDPPHRNHWAYRPTGAFSVSDYAHGAYTVAFALNFLNEGLLGGRSSWCTGIELDATTEVDFAMVLHDHHDNMDEPRSRLLLGEAKSFGRFESHDFARAARLRERYPNVMLVFATLRETLTDDEKAAVTVLARPEVDRPQDLPWDPPVLLLTATELFSREGAPECWHEAGGRAAELAEEARTYARPTVSSVADVTIQLHLGLEPHHEWWKTQRSAFRTSAIDLANGAKN